MMTSHRCKFLAILAVTSLVAGCKLAVIVPSGGDVTSLSGTRNCAGGSLCEFNISDKTFNESFTAVAQPGYVFSKWAAGDGFLCGNSTNSTCLANNTNTPSGYADIDNFIAGGSIFYAMPLFTFVGIDTDGDGTQDHVDADDDNDGIFDVDDLCPLNVDESCRPETITAGGKEWLQVSLFKGLSWNDINAVCPAGVCNGFLNGRDMTGWTWASAPELRTLFDFYELEQLLTKESADAWVSAGWMYTFSGCDWDSDSCYTSFEGYTREPYKDVMRTIGGVFFCSFPPMRCNPEEEAIGIYGSTYSGTGISDSPNYRSERRGGWFFRSSSTIVGQLTSR